MTTTAWVTTTFVGWHNWPDAPDHRSYLADSHRHLFHVKVEVEVFHDDREVEYHDLLALVKEHLPGPHLGAQSCEMIAERLAKTIQARLPLPPSWDLDREEAPRRHVAVTVSEDGETGSTVTLPGARNRP